MATPVVRESYSNNATNVAAIATNVTTVQTDWIILALIYNENHGVGPAATVSSITGAGLTWALRKRSNSSATGGLELWWAHGTGTLSSATVTVNMAGAYDDASLAFVFVSGCSTTPFDTNVGLPAALSAPTATWTPSFTGVNTSNANDLLVFGSGAASGGRTPATGFTNVVTQSTGAGAWASLVQFDVKSVTAIQSSATFTLGAALTSPFGSVTGEAIFDALSDAPAAPGNTTWSTTDKTAGVTVSGSNLVVSASAAGNHAVRTVDRQISGKYYWEITTSVNTINSAIGAAHAGAVLSNTFQSSVDGSIGCAFVNNFGTVNINGVAIVALGSLTVGTIVCIALDLTNQRIWFRYGAAGNWNGGAGNNPATNVGGFPVPFNVNGLAAAYPLAVFTNASGGVQTANFGDTVFSGTVPVGFTSGFPTGTPTPLIAANTQILVEEWGASNPAAQLTQLLVEEWAVVVPPLFTSWNPGDKSVGITLAGSNLIATNNNNAVAGVRAVDKQVSGKYYWECTCTTWTNSGSAVGVAVGYYPLTATSIGSGASGVIGSCAVNRGGTVVKDGASTATTLGTIASGSVVGIALDLDNKFIWFRLGAAGLWQGSGTANPATTTGGTSIAPNLGGAFQVYPAASPNAINDQVTANFGDTVFVGVVPSGFTAGFPAGLVSPVNKLATQVGLEQWASMIPPDMRATQTAIEHWTSTSNLATRMHATQAAIEHWGPVTSAVAAVTRQAAVTVVT